MRKAETGGIGRAGGVISYDWLMDKILIQKSTEAPLHPQLKEEWEMSGRCSRVKGP